MKRLLFLIVGPNFMPESIPIKEKFGQCLSKEYSGDIMAVVNDKHLQRANVGNFKLQGLYLPRQIRHRTLWRDIFYTIFSMIKGVYSHYFVAKYDAIVAKEPLVTGLIALILARLTGSKCVVEVLGNFESAFRVNAESFKLLGRLKEKYARTVLPFVLNHADGVRLLYPGQVKEFVNVDESSHYFIFSSFVSVSQFEEKQSNLKYILFLGYPWHLKGVDVLIKAFNEISEDFPDYTLKVVGYCPDKTPFVKLVGSNTHIELCDPVNYHDVIRLMSECSLFVLPSRTEGMGSVLLEAMASKKPVIGSNVDGIPYVIKNGETGLLFESENVHDLANKMRAILSDPEYGKKLALNGYQYVRDELTELRYLERFSEMLNKVCNKK